MGVSFSYPQKQQQQQKAILKEIEEGINKLKVRTQTQDPFSFPRTSSIYVLLVSLFQAIYYVLD